MKTFIYYAKNLKDIKSKKERRDNLYLLLSIYIKMMDVLKDNKTKCYNIFN